MFDLSKPTVQMLGRWQPWHDAHTALFKEALAKTGQVCIMIRAVPIETDNPFDVDTVIYNIVEALNKENFTRYEEYNIMIVPNIVDISYGRTVGYTFTKHELNEEMQSISATKIRAKLRSENKL